MFLQHSVMAELNLFGIVVYAGAALLVFECVYSLYANDGVYALRGFLVNMGNGVVLRLVSDWFTVVYLGLFATWYVRAGHEMVVITPVAFVTCLLLVDLAYYLFHRLHHASDFFWMFHHVHHGDTRFNLSTAFRISWIEQIYILLFFVPIVLIGFHPATIFSAYTILYIYQFYCHSQYLRFPHFFGYLLVTPQSHAIHHDQVDRHQRSNFGGIFSIWDRLFGTYTEKIPTFTPGIVGYVQENMLRIHTDPIRAYIAKCRLKR